MRIALRKSSAASVAMALSRDTRNASDVGTRKRSCEQGRMLFAGD